MDASPAQRDEVPFRLQTERLSLRPLLQTDGTILAQFYRDPEVARFIELGRFRPPTGSQVIV